MQLEALRGTLIPLMRVFVDAGSVLSGEPALDPLRVKRVVIGADDKALASGGVLLCGNRTGDGTTSLPILRELRWRLPHLAINLCVGPELTDQQIASYARCCVDEYFVIRGPPGIVDLLRHVRRRIVAPPPERELTHAAIPGWSPSVVRYIRFAFRNGYRDREVGEVASLFGISCRTLREQLASSELPCMDDLLRCGRYLHLAELKRLGVDGSPELASRLGFATSTDLRQWRNKLRKSVLRKVRLAAFVQRFPRLKPLSD